MLAIRAAHHCRSTMRGFHQQSVRSVLQKTRTRLTEAGCDPNDANILVANALQPQLLYSNDLFWHSDRKFDQEEANNLERMVFRRCNGEPIAYVVGHQEFWSLRFKVTRDTLIPRSDSEVLIETLVHVHHRDSPLRILDLGTGSGCLIVAALSEFPEATGVGIDICSNALQVATFNAYNHNLSHRASFLQCDILQLPHLLAHRSVELDQLYQQFDVILSNPPYIPYKELHLMGNDVVAFEPHRALFSGYEHISSHEQEDTYVRDMGLLFYKSLTQSARYLLDPSSQYCSSALVMEIGSEKQAKAVKQLFMNQETSSFLQFEQYLFDGVGLYRGLRFSR